LIIREASATDIPDIVDVHIQAFQGFLMTRLGKNFLKTYYEVALSYDNVLAFVACNENNKPVGFVVGYYDPRSFYSYFSTKKKRIAWSMAGALLRNPFLLPRVLASKTQADTSSRDEDYSQGVVELASVAVIPEAGGKGTGKKLLQNFIEKSIEKKANAIFLTTDLVGNDATLKFYEKNRFTPRRDFITPANRKMRQYELKLQIREETSNEG